MRDGGSRACSEGSPFCRLTKRTPGTNASGANCASARLRRRSMVFASISVRREAPAHTRPTFASSPVSRSFQRRAGQAPERFERFAAVMTGERVVRVQGDGTVVARDRLVLPTKAAVHVAAVAMRFGIVGLEPDGL